MNEYKDPLLGKFFSGRMAGRGFVEGKVEARVWPDYLIHLYREGEPTGVEELLPSKKMSGWKFYPSLEAMKAA